VQRSFYYWKTVFNLTPKEQQTLTNLSVQKLYVKFFDVDWNKEQRSAQPVAKSIFSQNPPANITITVVFITQEAAYKKEAELFKKFKNNPLFGKFKSAFGNTEF
jgi:hypothetical protein